MKRLEMRDHTRRAVGDIGGMLLAEFGIVLSFNQVQRLANSIDCYIMQFGECCKSSTPDQWNEMKAETVKVIE